MVNSTMGRPSWAISRYWPLPSISLSTARAWAWLPNWWAGGRLSQQTILYALDLPTYLPQRIRIPWSEAAGRPDLCRSPSSPEGKGGGYRASGYDRENLTLTDRMALDEKAGTCSGSAPPENRSTTPWDIDIGIGIGIKQGQRSQWQWQWQWDLRSLLGRPPCPAPPRRPPGPAEKPCRRPTQPDADTRHTQDR